MLEKILNLQNLPFEYVQVVEFIRILKIHGILALLLKQTSFNKFKQP